MRCAHCGYPLTDETANCPNCGKEPAPVSVLSPQEREAFEGVTIEQDGNERKERREGGGQRVYFRQLHFGGSSWSGLAALLIIALVIGAFLFFALPIIMLLLAAAAVIWLVKRLFA
ncbi:MAG: hypothetical protein E6X17_07725 [Sporomusaceae bacterium]|nr:hypothetical protein [Sporomusaceae bacterium]